MINTIINDVTGIISGVFLNGDLVSLAIAFGSVIAAALIMRRATQIGGMTLLALTIFVLASYVRAVVAKPAAPGATTGSSAVGQLEASWAQFMNMQAGALLAYFLSFMALIMVFFAVKSVVHRA